MIKGIGTDLVEINRIEKACHREAFLLRWFTEKEQEIIGNNMSKAAGNFAVKEAVVKAFGTGFDQAEPRDIEVLRDDLGKPYICLYGGAKKLSEQLSIKQWHVSITNTETLAMAFVIGEE